MAVSPGSWSSTSARSRARRSGPPGATPESIGPVADTFVGQLTGLDAAGWRRQGQVTINGMIDTVAKGDGALQDWVTSEPDVIRAPCTRPS